MPAQTFFPFAVMFGAFVGMIEGRRAIVKFSEGAQHEKLKHDDFRKTHERSRNWEKLYGQLPTRTKHDPYVPGVTMRRFW